MKTIYATHTISSITGELISANDIVEKILSQHKIRFIHRLASKSILETYETESGLQIVIVDEFSNCLSLSSSSLKYTIEQHVRQHNKRYDFVKKVRVYNTENESIGSIELGIDMVEYGGGDWDEKITYSPEFTALTHFNVSDDVIQDVINFVKTECNVDEFDEDLDYEWSAA